jgi:signal peptidase I
MCLTFMTTPDDLFLGPDGEAEGSGRRSASSSGAYDPLLSGWDGPAETADIRAPGADITFAGDELFWEMPADSVLAPEKSLAEVERRYPDRFQPSYHERLTELQRRLRAQTYTVPAKEHRWVVTVRELAETLLLAALIFLAVRASFQNFRVDGASMQPSLQNGEYLIVNKLAYASVDLGPLDWLPFVSSDGSDEKLWGTPNRGDIIVFRAPTDPDRDFIKRIIGLPGDTVEIDRNTGEVRVNGELLSESYIQGKTTCQGGCVFVIPERDTPDARAECGSDACYFVMGDNRQNSSDSRQDWLVPEENIIGKALITYWHDGSPNFDLAPNHSVDIAGDASASDE